MFLSLKYLIIIFFWLTNIEKICFWPKCLNENNSFQKNWWSIFSYIILIFHLHFHTRISPNFTLKYIYHFSYFVVSIILMQIYHHIHNIHLWLNIFEELSTSSSKNFKISKVHNIFIKFGVHILLNFWNVENCTLWQQFWGTLMCFCKIPTFYSSIFQNVNIGYKAKLNYSQGMNQWLMFVNFTSTDLKCLHLNWYPIKVEMILDTWPMLIMIYESWFHCEWKWIKFMSSFSLVNYLVKSRFFMHQCCVVIWMIINTNVGQLLKINLVNQFNYSLPTFCLLIFW
jgi:hypothetical protein